MHSFFYQQALTAQRIPQKKVTMALNSALSNSCSAHQNIPNLIIIWGCPLLHDTDQSLSIELRSSGSGEGVGGPFSDLSSGDVEGHGGLAGYTPLSQSKALLVPKRKSVSGIAPTLCTNGKQSEGAPCSSSRHEMDGRWH